MPRLLAFRAATLIVPILFAAIPARAAGPAALSTPAPGDPCSSFRTSASCVRSRIESACRHAGPASHCPPPRFPRSQSHRTPSFAEAPTAPARIEPIPICLNRPMHLADFLLQTHSAFHLATDIGRPSTVSGPTGTTLGWISFGPVPIT